MNRLLHPLQTRHLKQRLAAVKAENDRVFFHALDNAPAHLRGKARMRWALDVMKMGEEYEEERRLRRALNPSDGPFPFVVKLPSKGSVG